MARWVDVTVVLVLIGVVMAGQQCMSVKARELVDTNMLMKTIEAQAGLLQHARRDVDLAAVLASATADPSISVLTTFNVTVLLGFISGNTGDGKTFFGTGSQLGFGVGTGLLFQSSAILDTTSFEVQPPNNFTLRAISFSNAEGEVVGTWIGAFTTAVIVPGSTGSGTFTATTTTTTTA